MSVLPQVLAGPIVRRVDNDLVCVWIALSKPADVTLHVFKGRLQSTGAGTTENGELASQTRHTRPFGTNLHVVAVDVSVPGLIPLTRYCYDLVVADADGTKGLKDLDLLKEVAGANGRPTSLPLGYATGMLPSFVTPAAEVADLRLIHTSCRKSNGPAGDALAWLDDHVKDGLTDNNEAPQMVFLTGDQIYADDVGSVLLPMLAELGMDLAGVEQLAVGDETMDVTLDHFPALRRQGTVRKLAQFTSTDAANHLLSYGEFCAMYCAALSPTVWRDLPEPVSIFQPKPGDADKTFATDWENEYGDTETWKTKKNKSNKSHLDDVTEEAALVKAWRDDVPRVARALANVATYMIFDDHEITDDWYISDRWRRRVLGSRFGRGVIRNGLLAYTAFQGWGNDPATFHHEGNIAEDQKSPNEKLLDAIELYAASAFTPTGAVLDKIDPLLGLDKPDPSPPKATFHYSVAGAKYLVRVMDTRTRRTYAAKGDTPPRLLGSSMDAQVPKGPFTDGRELLVVISAAPVLFPRIFEALLQPVSALVFDLKHHMFGREEEKPGEITGLNGSEDKDIEGWRSDEVHHETFLRRLGTYPRVVTLGGDVHFASTLALDFWAKGEDAADSRIVNCTCSAARNQPGEDMRGYLRTLRIGQQLLRGVPAERLGWDGDHGIVLPPGASIRPGRRARLRRKPVILPAQGWPTGTTIDASKPPDWRWRVQVLRDERAHGDLPAGAPDVPVLTWNTGDPLASYADLAGRHQQVALAPKDPVRLMVFRNNLGIVSFAKDGADYAVTHTLLSMADTETGDAFTTHSAAFKPNPAPTAPVLGTV
jgi:hypothetical protein